VDEPLLIDLVMTKLRPRRKVEKPGLMERLYAFLKRCARHGLLFVGVLLISLGLSLVSASNGISISHGFGDAFTLSDDTILATAIVRNHSPFSVPYVTLSYSYGAQVIEGNALCELNMTEGLAACGSRTVWLGTINPGESKTGKVMIQPKHGNFTLAWSIQVWVFSFFWDVASANVHCRTPDGSHYACRSGTQDYPGEVLYSRLSPFMLLELLGILLITVDVVMAHARNKNLHRTKPKPPRPIAEEMKNSRRSKEPTTRR